MSRENDKVYFIWVNGKCTRSNFYKTMDFYLAFAILMAPTIDGETILNEIMIHPSWSLWATCTGLVENPANLWSVVALKTAVPTHSSSGRGSQRWQAGLIRYITSSYINTHMMLLYFFGNCLIITTWNSFKRNTTQSCSRERLRLQASGMHKRPTSEEQEHKRQVKDKRFGRGYLMWPKGIGSAFSPWT